MLTFRRSCTPSRTPYTCRSRTFPPSSVSEKQHLSQLSSPNFAQQRELRSPSYSSWTGTVDSILDKLGAQ